MLAEGHELGLELVLQGTGWRVAPTLQPLGAYRHFIGIVGQRACSPLSCSALASTANSIIEVRAQEKKHFAWAVRLTCGYSEMSQPLSRPICSNLAGLASQSETTAQEYKKELLHRLAFLTAQSLHSALSTSA